MTQEPPFLQWLRQGLARLGMLTGLVATLVLPMLIAVPGVSAADPLPIPPDGATSLQSGCTLADANDMYLTNDDGPVEFHAGSVDGYAGGGTLKSRSSASNDDCGMTVRFDDTVVVGPGSSGLSNGDPVTLSVTLGADGSLFVDAGSGYAEASGNLTYAIEPAICPEGCEAPVSFQVRAEHQSYAGDAYGRTSWDLITNDSIALGEYSSAPSFGVNTGTHSVTFITTVGAELHLWGQLNTFATGNNGGSAGANFYNTFTSTRINPSPGYEGVSISYASETTENQAPNVDASGPYTVNEGGSVEVSAIGSDPENGILAYAWDLNNDGAFETPGQTVNFLATALDGPTTATITVQITDDVGNTATDTATVQIVNVAPVVSAGGDITITAGDTVAATASFNDPGTGESYSATVDYGDGSTPEPAIITAGQIIPLSHVYANAGSYTVTVTVCDGAGSCGSDTLVVTVNAVVTPTQMIDNLMSSIQAATIDHGIKTGLLSKLNSVQQSVEAGEMTACDTLTAFINEVKALQGKKIPAAEAHAWITAASDIEATLGCP